MCAIYLVHTRSRPFVSMCHGSTCNLTCDCSCFSSSSFCDWIAAWYCIRLPLSIGVCCNLLNASLPVTHMLFFFLSFSISLFPPLFFFPLGEREREREAFYSQSNCQTVIHLNAFDFWWEERKMILYSIDAYYFLCHSWTTEWLFILRAWKELGHGIDLGISFGIFLSSKRDERKRKRKVSWERITSKWFK